MVLLQGWGGVPSEVTVLYPRSVASLLVVQAGLGSLRDTE